MPHWRPEQSMVDRLDALINQNNVAGARYPDAMQRTMDSEEFQESGT